MPLPLSLGISFVLPLPAWTGLLLAAPKQRQSHSKKRKRQLAGNTAIRAIKTFGRCPSCGRVRRLHTLCLPCVLEVRKLWRQERVELTRSKQSEQLEGAFDESKLTDADKELSFPHKIKRPSEDQEKLADKQSYIPYRRAPQYAQKRR